jgi:hypothetical protein
MVKTANLELPLVQAAQAQKHVTVNEALALLDAAAQLRLESVTTVEPPAVSADGVAFFIPPGASGDWASYPGRLAVFSNGGWIFVVPRAGWRGWIVDMAEPAVFDGVTWIPGAVTVSPSGAALCAETIEIDVELVAGVMVTTDPVIPANAVVLGVSGIVTEAITGTVSSWRLGVADGADRYGNGLGLGLGSWVQGVTGQPQAYYAPTSLTLGAVGGAFAGGRVRLAVHVFRIGIPRV